MSSGLELRPLDRRSLRLIYRSEMTQAFPRAERKPLRTIRTMVEAGLCDPVGLWRSGALMGYALSCPIGDDVLLDYLAVCAHKRGEGVGGAMLDLLAERYAGRALVVEAEAPETARSPEERVRRERRLGFYLHRGFRLLDYQAQLFTVRYTMLVRGKADEAAVMAAHRAFYQTRLPAGLYRRYVQIPAPAGPGGRRPERKEEETS